MKTALDLLNKKKETLKKNLHLAETDKELAIIELKEAQNEEEITE